MKLKRATLIPLFWKIAMQSFQWGKHFLTGLSEVDDQHYELVQIINRLGEHFTDNNIVFDDIEKAYNDLVDYTGYHFTEEEEMMFQSGIDERHITEHKEIHKSFIAEVTHMHAGISVDNVESANDLLEFLVHWLGYHILGTDQNMARQIRSIKAGATASEAFEKDEYEQNSSTEPLLAALNGLFKQVSKRNNELVLLNQSLEDKVAKRTQALVEVNLHFEELALTDVLTGLPNRRHAIQQLTLLWNEAKNKQSPLSCMMIDADHFKEINDTHGHDAGDLVLCELSKTLLYSVRTDDVVSRLGGDEFFIVCPNTDEKGVMIIANNTHKSVSGLRIKTGDGQWCGSISVGVATITGEMDTFEDLIKAADKGVYAAKRDGKNCVRSAS